jgi:hypothetical protein
LDEEPDQPDQGARFDFSYRHVGVRTIGPRQNGAAVKIEEQPISRRAPREAS